MKSKYVILGLALSVVYAFQTLAQEKGCTPKKAHLQGQTVELTENCMLSFPGYGNNNYGRSYTDQFGELFVFAEVAKTGITSKDYDLSPLDATRSISSVSDSDSHRINCRCIFNGTKNYQLFEETKSFFGRRKVHRKWTCEYTCQVGSHTDTVIGSYEMTNRGEDNGLEGICEGTVYEAQFNSVVMREVYMYQSTESFNPAKGKAAELKRWAESQSCDKGSWLHSAFN